MGFVVFQCTTKFLVQSLPVDSKTVSKQTNNTKDRIDVELEVEVGQIKFLLPLLHEVGENPQTDFPFGPNPKAMTIHKQTTYFH